MRTIGILVGLLALGCGGGERGPVVASDGGAATEGPECIFEDAGVLGAAYRARCPEGEARVCGASEWRCSSTGEGWDLYGPDGGTGETPLCDESTPYCPSGDEPDCVTLPDCG